MPFGFIPHELYEQRPNSQYTNMSILFGVLTDCDPRGNKKYVQRERGGRVNLQRSNIYCMCWCGEPWKNKESRSCKRYNSSLQQVSFRSKGQGLNTHSLHLLAQRTSTAAERNEVSWILLELTIATIRAELSRDAGAGEAP